MNPIRWWLRGRWWGSIIVGVFFPFAGLRDCIAEAVESGEFSEEGER